ncbi:hypothetical protein [Cellulosimicrobium marinum]|uniref:hypothetical protein n=1 Tax=Cellulosimicrobium marinum TaxID=1638992 RepID=UPI001E303E4B|nr:hypothetical protein [Cellulosimicrobium marinum]MCB7135284.1 hypothetical protein [Cellulosimicrobium marinum]
MTWTARYVGGDLDGRTTTLDDDALDWSGHVVHDPAEGTTTHILTQTDPPQHAQRYERRPDPDGEVDYLLVLVP